jgi:chromosome segregation ATPase
MSDDIQNINASLQSENQSLKSILEQLSDGKNAWRQTAGELLEANINLKSALSSLEKQLTLHKGVIADKNRELDDIKSRLNELEKSLSTTGE